MQPDFAALLTYYARERPAGPKKKRQAKKKAKKKTARRARATRPVEPRSPAPRSPVPAVEPTPPRRRRVAAAATTGRRAWVTSKITVNLAEGAPREIKAQVLAPAAVFAIHSSVDQRGLYDLTHVPTGSRIYKTPVGARGLSKLKKLAQKLERAADWSDPRIVRDHRRMLESGQDSRFMRELARQVAGIRESVFGR